MIFRIFFASLVLALLVAGPASARGTLDSILPQIRADHPGRLSDAEPWTDSEGRTHYRIKWMTPEGRILYFNADAQTGRYSNTGGDGYDRGDRQWNGGRDSQNGEGANDGGRRSHWNGDGSDRHDDGGRWNGGGNRDWRGHDGGDRGGWHGGGRHGDHN